MYFSLKNFMSDWQFRIFKKNSDTIEQSQLSLYNFRQVWASLESLD